MSYLPGGGFSSVSRGETNCVTLDSGIWKAQPPIRALIIVASSRVMSLVPAAVTVAQFFPSLVAIYTVKFSPSKVWLTCCGTLSKLN